MWGKFEICPTLPLFSSERWSMQVRGKFLHLAKYLRLWLLLRSWCHFEGAVAPHHSVVCSSSGTQRSGVPSLAAEDATPLSLRGLRPTPPRFREVLPRERSDREISFFSVMVRFLASLETLALPVRASVTVRKAS